MGRADGGENVVTLTAQFSGGTDQRCGNSGLSKKCPIPVYFLGKH
jgi:hypothetical protein